jgi:hypothetical protein
LKARNLATLFGLVLAAGITGCDDSVAEVEEAATNIKLWSTESAPVTVHGPFFHSILANARDPAPIVPAKGAHSDDIAHAVWTVSPSIGVIDPQIAVGRQYTLVTTRGSGTSDHIEIFDKAGNFYRGVDVNDLFAPLTADINASLNLPPGYSSAYDVDPATYPGNTYYDTRAVYDPYRDCYWIAALVINNKAAPFTLARRAKFAVAVSPGGTQLSPGTPFGMWKVYWWDAVPYDGQYQNLQIWADYPLLGISRKYVLLTDLGGYLAAKAGPGPDPMGTTDMDVGVVPADALLAGRPLPGWQFWNLHNPDGSLVSGQLGGVQPARQRGALSLAEAASGDDAYFVGAYAVSGVGAFLDVWTFHEAAGQGTLTPRAVFIDGNAPDAGKMGIRGAGYAGGKLVATYGVSGSVRALEVDMSQCTLANAIGTPDGLCQNTLGLKLLDVTVAGARMPAIAVNDLGDVAFSFEQASSGNVSTLYRSTHPFMPLAVATPLQPITALQSGGAGDNTSIAVDPDGQGIWVFGAFTAAANVPGLAAGRLW